MTSSSKSAVIYCRVSTRGQGEEGTSLQTQEQHCRAKAQELGYEVAFVFHEMYSGAEIFDRPQLNLLRDEVKTKKHGAVIVYALDRLTRAQGHAAYLLAEFERGDADLISVTDPLDKSLVGRLILSVKEFVAAAEREKFRERSLRGRLARVHQGKIPAASFDLYGYRKDRESGTRTPYEPEAAIVRTIFTWVAEGASIREVIRRLNSQNVPAPSSGKVARQGETPRWGHSTVHRILRRSDYKGESFYWRWKTTDGRNGHALRDEQEWVRIPEEASPRLVSPELWQQVQAQLDKNREESARNTQHEYLLRGKVFCGACHSKMHIRDQGKKGSDGKQYRAFVCSSRSRRGQIGCEGHQVHLDLLETWVWERVAEVLENPELIAAQLEREREQTPEPTAASELAPARRALKEVERRQQRLIELYSSEEDAQTLEMVRKQLADCRSERERWEARLRELEQRAETRQQTEQHLDGLVEYCRRVAERLQTFSIEEKRLALDALGIRIYASSSDWELAGTVAIDPILSHSVPTTLAVGAAE